METNQKTTPNRQMRYFMTFSAIHKNHSKTLIFAGSALPGHTHLTTFFVIFHYLAPCGRHLGALWRLWGALCRLWGPLWRLWVATWRPKARSGTPERLLSHASSVRVTRFWTPKALCRQPKVDGQGPNAIGHGLAAKHTKTCGKLSFFMLRRCSGPCFGELFS